ncbi:MAG: glycosyltransferase family 4 protein [Granulosicoccus sp.]|nr:glycosyltransferase family 4 protein [Granulosicoccus sp.]
MPITALVPSETSSIGSDDGPKALRILFAVDSNFPGFGGAEKQALKLARALRTQGIHVEFVSPQVDPEQALEEQVDGFSVTRIAYPKIPKFGALILMVLFRRYLINNAHRYDAVHVHITHLLAAAAGFARSQSQLPVITKISGYFEFEGGVLDQNQRFKPVNFIVRRGLRKVDHVQTISVQTRQKLLGAGFRESQIVFIPNGIELCEHPTPPPGDDRLVLGYCGRLREVKGVHILFQSIARLKELCADQALEVSIAGNGEARADLLALAEKLKIADQVRWLGRIEETSNFFRSLDIYVQPSFAEGLPNSVMEAMAEQRPVIASDIGGNSDLIDDNISGLLFPVGDASTLAQQILRLVDDPQLRNSIAIRGRENIASGYAMDQVISLLVEVYSGRN